MNGPDFQYDGLTAFAPITQAATDKKKGLMSPEDKARLTNLGGRVLASYTATGDLANGGTLTANVWNSANVPVLSFTPLRDDSIVLVLLSGNIVTGATETGVSFLLDGATRYVVGGGNAGVGMGSVGPLVLTSLSLAAHTLQFQIIAASTVNFWCRPGSFPNFESMKITVLELSK